MLYGVNMFDDAVRDLPDPGLRDSLGRYGKGKKVSKKELES